MSSRVWWEAATNTALSVAEGVCGGVGGDSAKTSSMTAFFSRSTETAYCFPFMPGMKYLACLRSTWQGPKYSGQRCVGTPSLRTNT